MTGQTTPTHVVVAGSGVAGAEALLALRALAGDRVRLTLVSTADELVVPPLSVAEAFALGRAERLPVSELLRAAQAEHVRARLHSVDPAGRTIELAPGGRLGFDALVLCVGAQPVARVEHATTWWPHGDREGFSGMLRDLEGGSSKRVAFVVPPGAAWPLPLYELALMTARSVQDVGITDAQLTVITPEAIPLAIFGRQAARVVHDELAAAGIRLRSGTVARVEPGHPISIVLQPTAHRLDVDRVIAVPGVEGPRIPGAANDQAGFIEVDSGWRMRGSEAVWAAGDAVSYPVKFGGLAAQQADAVAAEIARESGATVTFRTGPMTLQGVLMTGRSPRELTAATPRHAVQGLWCPQIKVFGDHLTPFLTARAPTAGTETPAGVDVSVSLPGPAADPDGFHALWEDEIQAVSHMQRLGHDMAQYRRGLARAGDSLRSPGQPPGPVLRSGPAQPRRGER